MFHLLIRVECKEIKSGVRRIDDLIIYTQMMESIFRNLINYFNLTVVLKNVTLSRFCTKSYVATCWSYPDELHFVSNKK